MTLFLPNSRRVSRLYKFTDIANKFESKVLLFEPYEKSGACMLRSCTKPVCSDPALKLYVQSDVGCLGKVIAAELSIIAQCHTHGLIAVEVGQSYRSSTLIAGEA